MVFTSEKSGLKLRGVVAQTLNLKAKDEELLIPIQRPRGNKEGCLADHHGEVMELKTRWLERSKVRKLPD